MNKFTQMKTQIEELNIKIAEKNCDGNLSRLINEINQTKQNGIVIGDDFLDEIRVEYFNSDFDSSNEEIDNQLNEIGKEEEYISFLKSIIQDLKCELED